MSLQITSQKALIGWDSQNATITHRNNGRQILAIRTEKSDFQMETVKPQVSIDQSEAFGAIGLKGIRAYMLESVGFAKQKAASGVDRIVSQGNEWLNIHTGNDPIPDQAIYNAFEMFEKSFNGAFSPVAKPQINVQSGRVQYNFTPAKIINTTESLPVELTYQPWRINYYMKQYSNVSINYTSTSFNQNI